MSSESAEFHPTNRCKVYYSQARRQDFAAGAQHHKRGAHFKYNIKCMPQLPQKCRAKRRKLYSHLPRPRTLDRYERRTARAPSFALLQLAQGKRQEIAYFANRWNFYFLVDCSRVSPLPLSSLSCRTSYSISGCSLYSRNKANRRYNVATEAQKQNVILQIFHRDAIVIHHSLRVESVKVGPEKYKKGPFAAPPLGDSKKK